MKAIVIEEAPAGPRLALRELPAPEAGPSDLLVRVAMAGINRADLALSKHHYALNPSSIAGSELSGEVVAVGAACTGFAAGDRVMGLASACYAELACLDHRLAVRLPSSMDWATAAALPAWFMTAHNALVTEGQLAAGEAVLIQGATSGVGIAAAQLARLLGARPVIGVARSTARLQLLRPVGLDETVPADAGWPEAVRAATGGRGVPLVIDMVGAGALQGNLESAAVQGRIVAVGRLGDASDSLDIGMLAFKRVKLIGVSFRSRSVDEKAAIARAFAAAVLPAAADGRIQPLIDRVFPLAEGAAAQEHMRRNAHFGKTLLAVA